MTYCTECGRYIQPGRTIHKACLHRVRDRKPAAYWNNNGFLVIDFARWSEARAIVRGMLRECYAKRKAG